MSIFNQDIPVIAEKLEKWIIESEEAGRKWAQSKALHDSIEDKRKPMLAKLMSGFDGSVAAKESAALADERYETFLKGLSEARGEFLQAMVAYDNAKLKVDALRTIISARKEEIRSFKG